MKPWDFVVERPDDLLVWSDLWDEEGAKAFADALRFIHAEKRWPRRKGKVFAWSLHSNWSWTTFQTVRKRKSSIDGHTYGIPHVSDKTTVRRYATLTAAFFDLMVCRATRSQNTGV